MLTCDIKVCFSQGLIFLYANFDRLVCLLKNKRNVFMFRCDYLLFPSILITETKGKLTQLQCLSATQIWKVEYITCTEPICKMQIPHPSGLQNPDTNIKKEKKTKIENENLYFAYYFKTCEMWCFVGDFDGKP